MLLRTLPLRTKLIAAMLLPLGVICGFLGVQITDAIDLRSNAQAQRAEIDRTQAVFGFAAAVGDEGLVMSDPSASTDELTAQRAVVDAAWANVVDPELGVGQAGIAKINAVVDEVAELRENVGTNPFLFRGRLTQAATRDEAGAVFARFGQLRTEVLDAFDFDRTLLNGSTEAQALNELIVVERVAANLGQEQASQLTVWSITTGTFEQRDIDALRLAATRSNESLASYLSVASSDARAEFREFIDSPVFQSYDELQSAGVNAQVGDPMGTINIAEVNRTITKVNAALADLALAKSAEVEAGADRAFSDAKGNLVRAAAIGGGLLVMMALILFALYQSIRTPLRRLTEQSRRVAEHDLPDIVYAIRNGDIDTVDEIEPIEAYTTDEIGDLVAAFNGMHRTAIDLAVEQAASRRVVADMFVNLGRRNQKLLNRMLKGLTSLERGEEDPDKLAALYQVDHLATRMRRNAESLLILAGAKQARTWDHAVPVYDVISAALSEVENYERVDVSTSEGELIKGEYVADLAHLVAELTENALAFSPPGTRVEIIAQPTVRGYTIIVNDHGVGMPAEALAAANQLIADAEHRTETPSEFLGHYVVGRLAARHGFTVDLLEGVTGVSARVLLSDSVFEHVEHVDVPDDAAELYPQRQPGTLEPVAQPIALADEPYPAIPEPSGAALEANESNHATAETDTDSVSDDTESHDTESDGSINGSGTQEPPVVPVADAKRPLVSPDALPQRRPARARKDDSASANDQPSSESQPAPLPKRVRQAAVATASSEATESPAFNVKRRKPGAQLPITTITSRVAVDTDLGDPDAVRSSLAGFQSGTNRADKEND